MKLRHEEELAKLIKDNIVTSENMRQFQVEELTKTKIDLEEYTQLWMKELDCTKKNEESLQRYNDKLVEELKKLKNNKDTVIIGSVNKETVIKQANEQENIFSTLE